MAQAMVAHVSRTDKAAAIIHAGGVIELEVQPGVFVISDRAGSGKGHLTTVDDCDCRDRQYRKIVCKHMRVVRQAAGLECCPHCGAVVVETAYYIGGCGYVGFMICPHNAEHYGRRLD